jgi:hypothetical protein
MISSQLSTYFFGGIYLLIICSLLETQIDIVPSLPFFRKKIENKKINRNILYLKKKYMQQEKIK